MYYEHIPYLNELFIIHYLHINGKSMHVSVLHELFSIALMSASINVCHYFFLLLLHHRIKLLTPHSLAVYDVGRRDKGMYQCLVTNKDSSAQAVAELKLGGKLGKTSIYSCIHTLTQME